MTTSISLADPWLHVAAAMAVPAYVLFLWSKRKLKKSARELNGRKGTAALSFFLWQLRWPFVVGAVALAGALALVVGLHRSFVGIRTDDNGLTLDYPWPRPNVRLSWADVSEAAMDKKEFGTWRTTRFCLRVQAADLVFYSPWSATTQEINQALDLIQKHLSRGEKMQRTEGTPDL